MASLQHVCRAHTDFVGSKAAGPPKTGETILNGIYKNPLDHLLELAEFVENGDECLHQVAFDGTNIWANMTRPGFRGGCLV